MKKINELSDDELSRWIAEKLGWKNIHLSPEAWADVCNQWHSGYVGSKDGTTTMIPDMIHDPAMTVMLLEKLHEFGGVSLYGANGWGVTVENIDENGVTITYTNPGLTNSETIGRAVAEAFALANGYN